ncbi:MAG TPA: thioredoxin domain-containing protein [Pyrinomonadaceae bacterium]
MNSLSSSSVLAVYPSRRSKIFGAPPVITSHVVLLIAIHLLIFFCVSVVRAQNDDAIVATVNGNVLRLNEVDAAATSKIFSLQQQIYAVRKSVLENLISRKVLEIEAGRRKISVDELKNQLLGEPSSVSADQVDAVYLENISAFGSMSPDEAKEKIRLDLQAQSRLKRYREELTKLRKTLNVQVLIDEPRLLVASKTASPSTGPSTAEVVITEFSDFQCPYCKAVQPTLKQLLREYGNRVRLEFKHLPLDQHAMAARSAQAAYCSGKQGRFWEYHDALFATEFISKDFLQTAAIRSGLQLEAFQACIDSPESRAAILTDRQEAKLLGIDGTPTFLINGKLLRGAASLDQFKLIIDREFVSGGQRR